MWSWLKKIHDIKSKCSTKCNNHLLTLDDDIFGVMDEIQKRIAMFAKSVKCVLSISGRLIGESDLKKEFEEFKMLVDGIIKTYLKKCAEMKDVEEKIM